MLTVLLSHFDAVHEHLKNHEPDAQWLVIDKNDIVGAHSIRDARPVDGFIYFCSQYTHRSHIQTYPVATLVEIMDMVRNQGADIQSFTRYSRNHQDFIIDMGNFSKVIHRIDSLDFWHSELQKFQPDPLVPEKYDRDHILRFIEKNLQKLSFHPGGIKEGIRWHKRHAHFGYMLPKTLQNRVKLTPALTLLDYKRKLARIHDYRKKQ